MTVPIEFVILPFKIFKDVENLKDVREIDDESPNNYNLDLFKQVIEKKKPEHRRSRYLTIEVKDIEELNILINSSFLKKVEKDFHNIIIDLSKDMAI